MDAVSSSSLVCQGLCAKDAKVSNTSGPATSLLAFYLSTSELLSLCPINTVVEGGDHILLIGLYKQILEHLIHGVLDGGVNTGGIIRT